MTVSLWLMVGAALAAGSPLDAGYEPDPINAEPFRPPLDPGALLATELPQVTERAVARADLWQAHNLLIWTDAETGEQVDLIGDLVTAHLAAARGNGHWRVGASVPLHALVRSDAYGSLPSFVAGDLMVSAKYRPGRLPLAVTGGVLVPLQGDALQLGASVPAVDVGLVAGWQGERLSVGANAGLRVQDGVTIDNEDGSFEYGSQAWYRLGAAVGVLRDWDLTAELAGSTGTESVYGRPLEVLVGTRREADSGRLLRAGVGVGVQEGIGAPTWRLLVGIGHDPGPLPQVDDIELPSDLLPTGA